MPRRRRRWLEDSGPHPCSCTHYQHHSNEPSRAPDLGLSLCWISPTLYPLPGYGQAAAFLPTLQPARSPRATPGTAFRAFLTRVSLQRTLKSRPGPLPRSHQNPQAPRPLSGSWFRLGRPLWTYGPSHEDLEGLLQASSGPASCHLSDSRGSRDPGPTSPPPPEGWPWPRTWLTPSLQQPKGAYQLSSQPTPTPGPLTPHL